MFLIEVDDWIRMVTLRRLAEDALERCLDGLEESLPNPVNLHYPERQLGIAMLKLSELQILMTHAAFELSFAEALAVEAPVLAGQG